MKCKDCKSCLKIVRIDKLPEAKVYYYCTFCDSVFDFYGKRDLVTDKKVKKEVKTKSKELYGDKI